MNVLTLRGEPRGGHVHISCFSGVISQTAPVALRGYGKAGELTITAQEWEAWRADMIPRISPMIQRLREEVAPCEGLLVLPVPYAYDLGTEAVVAGLLDGTIADTIDGLGVSRR